MLWYSASALKPKSDFFNPLFGSLTPQCVITEQFKWFEQATPSRSSLVMGLRPAQPQATTFLSPKRQLKVAIAPLPSRLGKLMFALSLIRGALGEIPIHCFSSSTTRRWGRSVPAITRDYLLLPRELVLKSCSFAINLIRFFFSLSSFNPGE